MEAISIDGLSVPEFGKDYLIVDVNYIVKPNDHGHAKITLRITDDSSLKSKIKSLEDKPISLQSKKYGVLFKGNVEYVNIIQSLNEHIIEVHLITTSIELDKMIKSYSVQDTSLTLKKVIDEAIEDEKGVCEYNHDASKNKKIEMPIIRYKESAWEFISRVASKHWVPIIVDETADKPTVKVGIKKLGSASKEQFIKGRFAKELNVCKYLYRKINSDDSIKIDQYKSIEVRSYENLKIGTSVNFENISGVIMEKRAYLDKGEIVFVYVVADEMKYAPNPIYNEKLHGASLKGKVVKCENENVKLQLFIDEEADKTKREGEMYWFPWQPEIGNLMYCMPEKDTIVSLYIGSKNEGEAIVINSIRDSKSKEITEPNNKYITSDDGKRMYLKEDQMGFSNKKKDKGDNYLYIKDDKEINFKTNKNFVMQADGKINIKSNRKINANSKKKINIINGSNSVNINKKFNVYAKGTELGIGVALAECIEIVKSISFKDKDAKVAQEEYNEKLREFVFQREDLSNSDKVELMRVLSTNLSKEQMKDFNILATPDALKPDSEGTAWGKWAPIDWPKRMGLAEGQKEISRDNPIPKKLDRIGSLGGTNFGVMREDGYKYTQDDRAITYIDNPDAYHTYEFDNEHYFDYIDVISDENETTPDRLNKMIRENAKPDAKIEEISQKDFDDMKEKIEGFVKTQKDDNMGTDSKYGLIGNAAYWEIEGNKVATGGAGQLNTPVSGAMLVKLGVLKEVK